MHAAVSPIAESPEASAEGSHAGMPAEPVADPTAGAIGHPSLSGAAALVHEAEPAAQPPEEPVGEAGGAAGFAVGRDRREAGRCASYLADGRRARPAQDAGPSLLAEEDEQEDRSEAVEPSGAAEGVAAQSARDAAAALLACEEDEEEGEEEGRGLARLAEQLHAQLVLDATEPLLAADEEEDEQEDGQAAAAAAAVGESGGVAEQQGAQVTLDTADALLAAEEEEELEHAAGANGDSLAASPHAGLLAREEDGVAAELTPLQQLMRMCCQEVRRGTC